MYFMLLLLASSFYFWRRWRFSLFKRLGIPGPHPSLICGNISEIKAKGAALAFSDWTEKYGDIVGFYNGAAPFILVKDVDLLKKVLVEDFHAFSDRGALLAVLPAPVSLNAIIFTASKDRWKSLRQAVSPAFTGSKLSQIFRTFEACSGSLADIIRSQSKAGKSIDAVLLLRRYSLDVMLKAGYSVDMHVLTSAPGSTFDRLTAEGVRLLQTLGLQGVTLVSNCLPELDVLWRWLVCATSFFTDVFAVIIQALVTPIVEIRRAASPGNISDVLQHLLSNELGGNSKAKSAGGIFTRAEVLYNACVYVFAGFDGTAHAVVAALYALAMHQDIQDKLREEIRSAINEEGKLTYETIGRLKYIDMCLNESMRLYYQNVGFITRRAGSDMEYKGIKIPKGVSVMAATSCLNQDSKIWSNPCTFDPERFNADNKGSIHPASFLPFGTGPRACVGRAFALMNIKVVVATLLSRFKILVDEERHSDGIQMQSGLLTSALPNSVWLKFEDLA